ncbi:MAG: hypothetical protein ACTSVA_08840 [Candidatus Njordarchaeales archaeon]
MPIIAKVPTSKVIETTIALLSYLRSLKNLVLSDMQINGYFLYRYRGILLVRKSLSDVLLLNDFDAVRRYLVYVMRSVLRSDLITWAKTAGLIEIILHARREKKSGIIVLEASNEEDPSRGNLRLRIIMRDVEKEAKNKIEAHRKSENDVESLIEEIDEKIYQEDLRDITPLDVYEFFQPREIEGILSIISKVGGEGLLTDYDENI